MSIDSPASGPLPVAPVARADAAGAAGARLAGLSMAISGMAILSVAAWLTPSSAGLGTHEQLRMPACGWIATLDLPCPSCGMTTAFAHAADGNLVQSAITQPLGCLLALICAMAVIVGTYVAATGSPALGLVRKIFRPSLGWMMLTVALLAWGYKILSYKEWLG